jgi:Helix-turn-helix of DDE superfamily endonuclease/DDE superfamily endonuclease
VTARFPEELGLPTQPTGSGPSSVYYTTGFSRCEIQDLCVLIEEIQSSIPEADRRDWPPILALGNSVVITLTYLRRNRVQWELAETYGVSQATVSRAITSITPLLARALARYVATAEELRPDRQYIVDGTLLPCWSWASEPGLYSGKHKTTGMNVQVVCTLEGELVWISDPVTGARHDVLGFSRSKHLILSSRWDRMRRAQDVDVDRSRGDLPRPGRVPGVQGDRSPAGA